MHPFILPSSLFQTTMIMANNVPLPVIAENMTCFHIDEYARETILSKSDFGLGAPSSIQDNAWACTPPPQTTIEKKKKNSRRRKSRSISPKATINRSSKNKNTAAGQYRWELSSAAFTTEEFPLHTANSNGRSQGRWSNGILDFKIEQKVNHRFCNNGCSYNYSSSSAARTVVQNITATLTNDLSPSSHNSLADSQSISRDHSTQRSSSLNSVTDPRHSLNRPERSPSNECLNFRQEHAHRSLNQQPKIGGQNFRWGTSDSTSTSKRLSSPTNINIQVILPSTN